MQSEQINLNVDERFEKWFSLISAAKVQNLHCVLKQTFRALNFEIC